MPRRRRGASRSAPPLSRASALRAEARREEPPIGANRADRAKRKRGKEAKDERGDRGEDADDAGSDSIMTGQPGPSEGAPEVSAQEKNGATGTFGASGVPKKSRSGRLQKKKEDRPKKDQSAADILVSIANA